MSRPRKSPTRRRSKGRMPRLQIRITGKQLLMILVFVAGMLGFSLGKGRVVKVIDGDTITVFTKDAKISRIRLYGIDSPESGQRGGPEATAFAASLASFAEVDIMSQDTDVYGRDVAIIRLPDGRLLNEELVREGHAWVYRNYCKQVICAKWIALENMARARKVGLWKDPNPQAPWRWRQANKGR